MSLTPFSSNLAPGDVFHDPITSEILTQGNLHASKFTADEVTLSGLTTDWVIVEHKSNTATGFSGTLFKNKTTNELVLSFRSTEFIDDAARDNQATNTLEVKAHGWAFGQIDDMQEWYNSLLSSGKLSYGNFSVTGYSLGGHLATAFNLINSGAAKEVVTFNGAGVGKVTQGTPGSVMTYFKGLLGNHAQIEATIDDASMLTVCQSLRAGLANRVRAANQSCWSAAA